MAATKQFVWCPKCGTELEPDEICPVCQVMGCVLQDDSDFLADVPRCETEPEDCEGCQ